MIPTTCALLSPRRPMDVAAVSVTDHNGQQGSGSPAGVGLVVATGEGDGTAAGEGDWEGGGGGDGEVDGVPGTHCQ